MKFKMKQRLIPRVSGTSSPYELYQGDIIETHPISPVRQVSGPAATVADSISYEILWAAGRHHDKDGDNSYGLSYVAKRVSTCSEDTKPISDEHVFIKVPRISDAIPHNQLASITGEIFSSFLTEYQNRDRIKALNKDRRIVAEIKGLGLYSVTTASGDEGVIPFLVQEFINEEPIDVVFPKQSFRGIDNPQQYFQIAEDLVDLVRRVHNHQIIHGEIIPKNILLEPKGEPDRRQWLPILVDFGKSFQLDVSSVAGSRIRRDNPYIAPECREKSLGWYTPADIYSLGGVLFYLATGTSPPDIMKPHDSLQEPAQEVGEKTDLETWKRLILRRCMGNTRLTAEHESIVKIIDKCMRPDPTDRYASAERVLSALRAVNHGARRADSNDVASSLATVQSSWSNHMSERASQVWDPLFDTVLNDRLQILSKDVRDMERGHFEIWGEREDMIDALVKYIGVLGKGDSYVTVTVPDYWTPLNLGINGRFLTLNKDLVRRGVRIDRLFLISEDDISDPISTAILRAHLQAWEDLTDTQKQILPIARNAAGEPESGMYVGYYADEHGYLPDRETVSRIQGKIANVAIWSRAATQQKMSITFFTLPPIRRDLPRSAESRIVKVRFRVLRNDSAYNELRRTFWEGDNSMPALHTLRERIYPSINPLVRTGIAAADA